MDNSHPHQIRLSMESSGTGKIRVSCTCHIVARFKNEVAPAWVSPDLETTWSIFNNPDYHNNSYVRFDPNVYGQRSKRGTFPNVEGN